MWGVLVRVMWIGIGVWELGSTPVMVSTVPVMWPGMVSVGVMVASAMVSVRMRLWSGPTASVFACHGGGRLLICCEVYVGMVICGNMQVSLKVVLYVDNLLLCVHIHHTQSIWHLNKWCAMWPASWHWKQQSSSLDITFTVEDGINIAVSFWVAWSFSTSEMASVQVCSPFS